MDEVDGMSGNDDRAGVSSDVLDKFDLRWQCIISKFGRLIGWFSVHELMS